MQSNAIFQLWITIETLDIGNAQILEINRIKMRPLLTKLSLSLSIVLLFAGSSMAQANESANHRFSVRMNLLGILNHDLIGELEYRVSDQVGVFVGGGNSSALVELGGINWLENGQFFSNGGGFYTGVNLAIPLGTIKGFSAKPIISYAYTGKITSDGMLVPGIPQEISYGREQIGAYLNVAYQFAICSSFFVEPVMGVGMAYGRAREPQSKFTSYGTSFPVQLNFGVRL